MYIFTWAYDFIIFVVYYARKGYVLIIVCELMTQIKGKFTIEFVKM